MKQREPKREMSREQLCEDLDLEPQTIIRHHQRANPPPHSRSGNKYLYDSAEYAAWMKAERLTGQKGRPAEDDPPDIKNAKLRKELALAEKHEIGVAMLKDKLVDKEGYKTEWMARIQAAKSKLLGMPAEIAPALYGQETSDIELQLRDRLEQIIRELAQ